MQTIYRQSVHFSGRVQGVGFRYSTLQTAKEYAVNGFVRNLADGRVLLVAEGERSEVQAFCAAVAERLSPFIRESAVVEENGVNLQYRGFVIDSAR